MRGKKPMKELKLSVPAQETPVDKFLSVPSIPYPQLPPSPLSLFEVSSVIGVICVAKGFIYKRELRSSSSYIAVLSAPDVILRCHFQIMLNFVYSSNLTADSTIHSSSEDNA